MSRLTDLQGMLAARTDPNTGKPLKGYRKNVAALKAEILRLCAPPNLGTILTTPPAPAVDHVESPALDTPRPWGHGAANKQPAPE